MGKQEVKSSDAVLSTTLAEALCLSYEGRGEMAKAVEVATAYIPQGRPFKVGRGWLGCLLCEGGS